MKKDPEGHHGEASKEAWLEFRGQWVVGRSQEFEQYCRDPNAYEGLLSEIFDMQQLIRAELEDLSKALQPSLRIANLRRGLENIRNGLKFLALLIVNSQYFYYMYGVESTVARAKYQHFMAIRKAIEDKIWWINENGMTEGSFPVIQDDDHE